VAHHVHEPVVVGFGGGTRVEEDKVLAAGLSGGGGHGLDDFGDAAGPAGNVLALLGETVEIGFGEGAGCRGHNDHRLVAMVSLGLAASFDGAFGLSEPSFELVFFR
jgi:hypothetical protein